MRKIRKAISIILAFIMIMGYDVCYSEALRVPIDVKYDGMKSLLDSQMPYLDAFVDKLSSSDHNVRAQAEAFFHHVLDPILDPKGNIPGRDYKVVGFVKTSFHG